MNEDGITIDGEAFAHDVGRFALLTGREFGDELKRQGTGVMRSIVKVTPPFHRGISAGEARKSGINAISKDLYRIFRPVKIKRKRAITHLFGKEHPDAPWFVRTKEETKDVETTYRTVQKLDSKGRKARYEKPLYVSQTKFRRLQLQLERKIGFLGGGFAPAAEGLGVALPAFMKRHAFAPGALEMKLTGDDLYIIISNSVRYGPRVYDFARRVEWAVQAQRGKMERQIPYLLSKHEKLIN